MRAPVVAFAAAADVCMYCVLSCPYRMHATAVAHSVLCCLGAVSGVPQLLYVLRSVVSAYLVYRIPAASALGVLPFAHRMPVL